MKALGQLGQVLKSEADGPRDYANEIDQINKSIIDICARIADMVALIEGRHTATTTRDYLVETILFGRPMNVLAWTGER